MIIYNKLFRLLIEKGMTKEQLKNSAGLSSGTMTKISKGESVTLKTINSICEVFQCQPGDILTWVSDETMSTKK